MGDQRDLTMGMQFIMSSATSQLSEALESIQNIKTGFQEVEQNAVRFGSEAAQGAGIMVDGLQDAQTAACEAEGSLEDIVDAGNRVQKSYREMGAEADSLTEAVKRTGASAIKETDSIAGTIKAGFQGAYGFAGKQADNFVKKVKTGAVGIVTAFTHPIRTIKDKLSESLHRAREDIERTGDEADRTGDKLGDMGENGASAGIRISDGIGSAVKSFFAISAAIKVVKAGISFARSFASAIMEAGTAAEQTGAKFSASFAPDSGISEWAENFSSAIHRSNTEVQGFLVSSKSMYQQLGITGEAANELSKITTSLAYDLGSAFKLDDSESLGILQDYIKGNTAVLSEYGIQIDDAILKQTALNMGLGSNIDQLDDAAMAQVRMNALLENSTDIQQAAAKKQEGYTNGIKSLKGIWTDFLSSAGTKFAPVFTNLTNTILTSWPQIEPALSGMVDMLSNGLASGLPVITDLAVSGIPFLTQTLGELFSAAAPIGGVILDLATSALPPLASAAVPLVSTFGTLAQNVLPPVANIINKIATTVVPPLVNILKTLSESVIVPLMPSVESIANAILPALAAGLQLIPPILQIISPILSGIAGILSQVIGFLGKIVEWAAGGIGSLLEKVTGFLGGGTSTGTAGVNIPHNDTGTDNFKGGWTHINEKGGELAFLPSGSAIIPADKTDSIIKNSRPQNSQTNMAFAPQINIEISGGADADTISALKDEMRQLMRETYQEMQEEHYTEMAIQQGNA